MFLKLSLLLAISLNCLAAKPNIIYINIDDLGWADVGYQGSTFYETPHIDKLASQSVVFTNGYAAAANCAPSRACALTGQATPRHGVYTVNNSDRGPSNKRKLIPTENTLFIKDSNLTLGHAMKAAGYTTATMGKWHVTKDPLKNGFDINIGGSKSGGPYTGGYLSPYTFPNLVEKEKGRQLTDHLTDEAIQFIAKEKDKPFFLYLPYFAVHTPLQAKKEKIEYFKKKAAIKSTKGQQNPTYAAMISSVDDNIGRLMSALEKLKLSENTVIIFTSDNGGVYNITKQHPLRAGKGSYYEGGIREPFLFYWKGKIKPRKEHTPITALDLFPTLLEITDTKLPEKTILDGHSLLPLLTKQEPLKQRSLYWHFPIYLQGGNNDTQDSIFRTRPGSAIRDGDWKLIQYFENNDMELYNLKDDLGERKNLAKAKPEKTRELLEKLNAWRKETNAPIPTKLNPDFGKQKPKKSKEKEKT